LISIVKHQYTFYKLLYEVTNKQLNFTMVDRLREQSVQSRRPKQKRVTAQKPLHPLIISNFTLFHEPKNRRPNISLTEIMENQQKVRQKVAVIEKLRRGGRRVRRPRIVVELYCDVTKSILQVGQ
jgi:hypothetical protein